MPNIETLRPFIEDAFERRVAVLRHACDLDARDGT